MRDAAVLLWLTLGQADFRAVPFELRPAVGRIEVCHLEAELLRVEGAGGVEIADVVPDRCHKASPGSSRKAFTSRRNSAPVAPSTARWSHVRVSSILGRTTTSPSTTTALSSV